MYNLGFMSHSRPNPAKGYSRRKIHRHFQTIADQTIAADRNLIDRTQQTVMTAIRSMDTREFVGAPDREKEISWMRRNLDVVVVGIGVAAVGAMTGLVLVSSAAPAVRPPAVEVSVSPYTSTPPLITPNPSPLPGPPSLRPGG